MLGLSTPNLGAQLCGFDDDSLAILLKAKEMPSYFTLLKFDEHDERYKRGISKRVGDACVESMRSVCPEDPALAFYVLRESAKFQCNWLFEDQYSEERDYTED